MAAETWSRPLPRSALTDLTAHFHGLVQPDRSVLDYTRMKVMVGFVVVMFFLYYFWDSFQICFGSKKKGFVLGL